jgi:probable F420-dependent oxidoreductase
MKFNLLMPMRSVKHYDRWIGDGHLTDVARLAEDAGFAGVSVTEHPFPDDQWLAQGGHHSFDPYVALSFMAAVTSRVQLITFVIVSGYRSPFVTAKALASLDKLSGGRTVAGMAAGYLKSEFEVLGADWDHRGPLFDAAIDAMRAAWTGETVNIDGPFPAHGHTQLPRPATAGGPPIWMGGNSGAARRRAAERGQGWMPIGQSAAMAKITKTPPLETIDELASLIKDVQGRRAAVGGEPLDVCFSPFGDRNDVAAWTKQILRDLSAYEDAGVTWLTIEPHARSLDEMRDTVARVADDIIAVSAG